VARFGLTAIAREWKLAQMLIRRIRWLSLILAVACALPLPACDRGPSRPSRAGQPQDDRAHVEPPPVTPVYTFAEDLRQQYPHITGFLQEFLETCLAGDYAGYRKLASRMREPEGRERFQAIFHAIRALHVQSIEPIDLPRVSDQTYRVTCHLDFHPDSEVRLRRKTDQIAILVLREEDCWRMLPAPSELQPAEELRPTTASAPTTTTAPSYPWDEDGDY
jgi:hypothetical protein